MATVAVRSNKMAEEKANREIPEQTNRKILASSREEKPRFRLKFAKALEIGRSTLSGPKLPGFYEPVVTSKFYTAHDTSSLADSEDVGPIKEQISIVRSSGPKEKYSEPILESHRYGWFQEKFIQVDQETERVHFPKRNSEMVKIQNLLDNAAKADQLYHMAKSKK